MPGRIPRSFIDDLLSRVDIVEVIDEYVPLARAGRDFKACCPFHAEKTPSFTVSRAKQFYHCFGCQASGTAVSFLMEYARLEFVEAVEELAHRAGLEVPREGHATPKRPTTEPLLSVLERASRFYRRQLRHHPDASRAVDYLRSRGLSGEIAAAFHIGFAPPGWENLAQAFPAERKDGLLVQAGLVTPRDGGGVYDRLRDRIVFPILDRRARAVGFGGRSIGDDTPKYLNTPETAVFHKGRELYGLPQARAAGGRQVVVVEGYMDVVALAQHGIGNTVATLGTALTPEHLKQLFRTWQDVVFCFDGDAAGQRAAWRALETALPLLRDGRQALFTFLPEGEDPDSAVRAHGRAHFESRIGEATTLGTFLFDKLKAQVDLNTIDGRARLVESARPLLEKLPAGAFRELADRKLHELTGVSIGQGPAPPGTRSALAPGGARPGPAGRRSAAVPSPVRKALALLLYRPELARVATSLEPLHSTDLPGAALLAEILALLGDNPHLTTAALLERYRDRAEGRHLENLLRWSRSLEEDASTPAEGQEQELEDCLKVILRESRKRRDDQRFRELAAKGIGGLSPEERREYARLTGAATK